MPGNARKQFIIGPLSTIAAGTAFDDYFRLRTKVARVRIVNVDLMPNIAMTADPTNYCTITLTNVTQSGTIGTRAWSATNSVAGTSEAVTVSPAPSTGEIANGDVIKYALTHAGTGLAGRVRAIITYEEMDT